MRDSAGQHLASVDDPRVEDNDWHTVRVAVELDGVTVEVDGEPLLAWAGEIDRSFAGVGFAATTTLSETNWHIIDNVRIQVTGTLPAPPAATASRDSFLLPALDARSCSLGTTPRSVDAGAPAWVEFANETAEPAVIFEVTAGGLVQLVRLEPTQRTVLAGEVGDRWLVTDARGDCRVVFEAASVPPQPSGLWLARVTAPAGTRVYRHQGLGFEFLRPRDELVQVLSGAAPGLAALAMGERIELFVVDAGGATLDDYAAAALPSVTIDRERQTLIDGLPAVSLEYGSAPGEVNEAATFVVREGAAYVLTFRRGANADFCAGDLATYRMLLRSFRFLDGAATSPTLLPSPGVEVSEQLCGGVLAPPAGADELTDLIASVGCGPQQVRIGDAVVCVAGLSDVATLTCWTVIAAATAAPECSSGQSSLTTSFELPGRQAVELIACTTQGCQTAVALIAVDADSRPSAPVIASLGCAPAFPHAGATVSCSPDVSDDVVEYCWSTDAASFLDGDSERCSAAPGVEGRFTNAGAAVVTLRACDAEGLCTEAAQLLAVDASAAALTFAPGAVCTPQPVLIGESVPCDLGNGNPPSGSSLAAGEQLVSLTACLLAAPLQPPVCVAYNSTVIVAANLADGVVLDSGVALEGARIDLILDSGGDAAPLLRRVFADAGGAFTLVNPPAGRYRLVISTAVEGGGWEQRASVELDLTGEGRETIEALDIAS